MNKHTDRHARDLLPRQGREARSMVPKTRKTGPCSKYERLRNKVPVVRRQIRSLALVGVLCVRCMLLVPHDENASCCFDDAISDGFPRSQALPGRRAETGAIVRVALRRSSHAPSRVVTDIEGTGFAGSPSITVNGSDSPMEPSASDLASRIYMTPSVGNCMSLGRGLPTDAAVWPIGCHPAPTG